MEPNEQSEADTGAAGPATFDTELVAETLVEEVSIDGMCGVY
jgi:mycofactocin precursor